MNNNQEIKNLTKGDIASVIFVVASVLTIIASDKEKEYLFSNDIKDKKTANTIYLIVLSILIVLYVYFIKVNHQAYTNCQDNEREAYLVRLWGSIFLLIGGLCFLYYRIDDRNNAISPVEL